MSEEKENKNKKERRVIKEKEAEIVTIHDFKSMLVGMDLVLGDEWTPTEDQWKRIRKKLDALIETAEQPNTTVIRRNSAPVDSGSNVPENDLLRNFPQVPVAGDVPIGEAAPTGQSALAPPPQVPRPANPGPRPPMATSDKEQVRTPDIDSSSGYKSSFV
jgi:hypothetical protein